MTIHEKQEALFPECTLCDIVIALRASITGQADPWSREHIQATVDFLRERKSTWTPSEDPIDSLILSMVFWAIELGEKEIKTRGW